MGIFDNDVELLARLAELGPEQLLSELLATIHRDGGHYEANYGTAVAVQDAMKIINHAKTLRGYTTMVEYID